MGINNKAKTRKPAGRPWWVHGHDYLACDVFRADGSIVPAPVLYHTAANVRNALWFRTVPSTNWKSFAT